MIKFKDILIESDSEIDNLLLIMNKKKAGTEYRSALQKLINLAQEKTGHRIYTKRDALEALDYIEPRIR